MAVFTPKRLSGPTLLSSSVGPAYTVPAGTTGVVKQIILNNTGSLNSTVTIHVVPNGGSPTTSNQVVSQLSIAGYSQIIWSADIPLQPGESVQLLASLNSVVTATISGIEIA